MSNDEIIKEEIEKLIKEVTKAYKESGKKVTGDFEKGLETDFGKNSAKIFGKTYLAGRKAGKTPPIKQIEEWVKRKGIFQINERVNASSIAWAIAKKIAKKGTNKEYHLKIYEKIITAKRIDDIVKKVSLFNVNIFVEELTTQLQLLQKNI